MAAWDDMVLVGRVSRPHGVHGHVIVTPDTDFVEDRFVGGATMWVRSDRGDEALRITSARVQNGRPVIAFEVVQEVRADRVANDVLDEGSGGQRIESQPGHDCRRQEKGREQVPPAWSGGGQDDRRGADAKSCRLSCVGLQKMHRLQPGEQNKRSDGEAFELPGGEDQEHRDQHLRRMDANQPQLMPAPHPLDARRQQGRSDEAPRGDGSPRRNGS